MRGAKGGYVLSTSPSEVTVYDIVIALEETISPSKCTSKDGHECYRARKCVPKDMWDEVEGSIRKVLEGYTLQDLIERTLEKNPCRQVKINLFENNAV